MQLHLVTEFIEGGTLHSILLNTSGTWDQLSWGLRYRLLHNLNHLYLFVKTVLFLLSYIVIIIIIFFFLLLLLLPESLILPMLPVVNGAE